MNKKLIDAISEGYVVDRDLTNKIDPKDISNFLMNSLIELRDTDPQLYEEMYFRQPKGSQVQILQHFADIEYFGEMYGYNKLYSGSKDYITEADIQETLHQPVTESVSTLGDIFSHIGYAIGSVLGIIGSTTWTALTYLFGTVGGLFFVVIPCIIIAVLFRKEISRSSFRVLAKLGQTFYNMGKTLKSQGTAFKYSYIIIHQNEEKCYKSEGIDKREISSVAAMALQKKGVGTKTMPNISVEQAKKLRTCYLTSMIQKIALFMQYYFACLKDTGSWDKISGSVPDSKILSVIMASGISDGCEEFRKSAKELMQTFDELLDFLFEFDPHEKMEWIEKLNSELIQSKKKFESSSRRPDFQRSSQGSFSSREPQKTENRPVRPEFNRPQNPSDFRKQ